MGNFNGYRLVMSQSDYEAYESLDNEARAVYRRNRGDIAPLSQDCAESTWETVLDLIGTESVSDRYMYNLGTLLRCQSELEAWSVCHTEKGEQGRLILSAQFRNTKGTYLVFKPDNSKYGVLLCGREIYSRWYSLSEVASNLPECIAYLNRQTTLKKGAIPGTTETDKRFLALEEKYEVLLGEHERLIALCSDLAARLPKGVEPLVAETTRADEPKPTSDWVMCNLRALRKSQGKTQKQMADGFGITRSTYQHYERDFRLPSELYAQL